MGSCSTQGRHTPVPAQNIRLAEPTQIQGETGSGMLLTEVQLALRARRVVQMLAEPCEVPSPQQTSMHLQATGRLTRRGLPKIEKVYSRGGIEHANGQNQITVSPLFSTQKIQKPYIKGRCMKKDGIQLHFSSHQPIGNPWVFFCG